MLSRKQTFYSVFLIVLLSGLYMLYQMLYKPWLPTEITLMNTYKSNKETIASNGVDSMITYYYIVQNPPYSIKGRYNMVKNYLENKSNLYPKKGVHRRTFSFSKEGWSVSNSFPYFYYIDRSYKDNPVTYKDEGLDDFSFKDDYISYGGTGFQGNDIASYELRVSSVSCEQRTFLTVSKPFIYLKSLANNSGHDSANVINYFYYDSESYTPLVPECGGAENEGDKIIQGLRL